MTGQTSDRTLPLDDVMLAMDVVDTLRHRQDLVERELSGDRRERQLIERLREIYHQQGIEVPDRILEEGVAALGQDRFTYVPPQPGLKHALALAYVRRGRWGKWVLGLGAVLVLALGAYVLAYMPYRAAQEEAARIELAETLPEQMRAAADAIFEETKVQTAVEEADTFLAQGLAAADEGARAEALEALERLETLRDRIRLDYTVRIVNREGVDSGFWTFPDVNRDATNYYVVVEGLDADGEALTLPIENEETGEIEEVAIWGLRVPEEVYNSVARDKQDDGIIQRDVVGEKDFGFVEPEYAIPTSGGTVTRW